MRIPAVAIALVFAAVAHAGNKSSPPSDGHGGKAASATAAGSEPIATVGGHTITRAELEDQARAQLVQVENQRYEALRNVLNEMVAQELEKQEAAARGITPGVLERDEIDAKVGDPSDDEVRRVYDANQQQLGGKTLEEMKGQIIQFLRQQRVDTRRAAFVEELKKKHATTIALRPPAFDVATAGRPEKGAGPKAPVTIVTFSDYQCPFCQRAEGVVDQVMQNYGDKVRFVFRDYPLPIHPHAYPAAEAANCANAQGKFWEYHAKLFANQTALQDEKLRDYAKDVGLDPTKFEQCLTEHSFKSAIDADMKDGVKLGVSSTPAFFINGRMLSGAQPYEAFKQAIDAELQARKTSY